MEMICVLLTKLRSILSPRDILAPKKTLNISGSLLKGLAGVFYAAQNCPVIDSENSWLQRTSSVTSSWKIAEYLRLGVSEGAAGLYRLSE